VVQGLTAHLLVEPGLRGGAFHRLLQAGFTHGPETPTASRSPARPWGIAWL
jgi:hypothetical protein